MDASEIETFPNHVVSRCLAKLSLASPASGVDKHRVALYVCGVNRP